MFLLYWLNWFLVFWNEFSDLLHSNMRAYIAACVSTIPKTITFVKLTRKIQRKIIHSIMILLTTWITNIKSDWVTTNLILIWIIWEVFSCFLKNLLGGGVCGPSPREGGGGGGSSCLYWEIICSDKEEIYEKALVAVADSAAEEAPRDIYYVRSSVNQ